MKVIYDKQTGTLLDATHVLIGDIDPYEQTTNEEMITEVLAQDRPLYEFENEKAETAKDIESKKGCREPEHYETLVVDIETYTKHALKLQMAIIEADSKLAKATRKHQKASARVREASKEWDEADAALDNAMEEFKKHLDIIRDTHVTLRKGPHE